MPLLINLLRWTAQLVVPYLIQDWFNERKAKREEAAKAKELELELKKSQEEKKNV